MLHGRRIWLGGISVCALFCVLATAAFALRIAGTPGDDVIPIEDGLVARKDVYSDGVTLLRQLGLNQI